MENKLNAYIRDSLARLEVIEKAVFEQRAELYKLKNLIKNENEYKISNSNATYSYGFSTVYLHGVYGAYEHGADDL